MAKYTRPALLWDITQRIAAVPFRSFGTICRSHLQRSVNRRWIFSPLKVGAIGCPETSVRNYHYMLRNIPEDCRSQYADLRCFVILRSLDLISSVSAQHFSLIIKSLDPIQNYSRSLKSHTLQMFP